MSVKNEKGLSLLEMSVGMGVLGGVMLISMNVVNQQKSNESYIRSKGEIQKAVSLLAINLKDPENCRSVVAGRKFQDKPSTDTSLTNLRVKLKKVKTTITDCTVSNGLPGGLNIDRKTCAIQGTPSSVSGASIYTLNVFYGKNTTPLTTSFSLYIDPAPSQAVSQTAPTIGYQGVTGNIGVKNGRMNITPSILKTSSSTTDPIVKCTTDKALPSGLTIDEKTCAITGTPTVSLVADTYTIRATSLVGGTREEKIVLAVNDTTSQMTVAESQRSASYKGIVGTLLSISPNLPPPPTTSSTGDEEMEILKPNTRYKDFKTESIDVIQQSSEAKDVVDLQVKFRIKNRDAKKWNSLGLTSDDDIIITEKIPLIITKDSTNTITDCTAVVSKSSGNAKEKFCKSLGVATNWDAQNQKCSFNANASCPAGQILIKMEGMKAVCEDAKNHIQLTDLFDETKCSSTNSYRVIESNGKLKIDCNNSFLISQRNPDRGGALGKGDNLTIQVDTDLSLSTVTNANIQVYLKSTTNNVDTFTLVNGQVTYNNKVITINPDSDLQPGKTYEVRINDSVKPTSGTKTINGIESGKYESWTFVAQ
jgi:hypothetical protein